MGSYTAKEAKEKSMQTNSDRIFKTSGRVTSKSGVYYFVRNPHTIPRLMSGDRIAVMIGGANVELMEVVTGYGANPEDPCREYALCVIVRPGQTRRLAGTRSLLASLQALSGNLLDTCRPHRDTSPTS